MPFNKTPFLFLIFLLNTLIAELTFSQPVISSFSPSSGPIGTHVTIAGTNFNPTPANNIVYFGATKASVTAASTTSLTVTVPTGATYKNISVTDVSTGLTAQSKYPFVVTFSCGAGIDEGSFATKTDIATDTNPYSVTLGDFDGDGKPDLAIANNNLVSVFRNQSASGNVSFSAKIDFPTASNPRSISFADFDGDGKLDIVVANTLSKSISVFRNISSLGYIEFEPKVDYTTGTNPRCVTTGDIDLDGKLDIAVVNSSSNTVSVFKNTSTIGNLSFNPKIDFSTGKSPYYVSIGDLNDDGKQDLVVVNFQQNFMESEYKVSVFKNTSTIGNISLANKIDFPTGDSPYSVAIGDLNDDGKPDLAVTNYSVGTLSLFQNVSIAGSISFAPKVDFRTGNFPYNVSINDIDGDAKPDIAVANYSSSNISVFKNLCLSGPISFAQEVSYTSSENPHSVLIGDIDGDGLPDIVSANFGSNSVSIFRNTVSEVALSDEFGTDNQQVKINTPIKNINYNVINCTNATFSGLPAGVTGTWNSNGVTISGTPTETGIFNFTIDFVSVCGIESKNGQITITPLPPEINNFTPTYGHLGESLMLNGNNFNTALSNNIVLFGEAYSPVTFCNASSLTTTVPIGSTYQNISVTDKISGLTAYSDNQFITTFLCEGVIDSNAFTVRIDCTSVSNAMSIDAGDLDGDNKDDLVVGNNYAVSIFRNNSTNGNISFESKINLPTTSSYTESVSINDIDGNGKPDIIVANKNSNTVSIFRNTCSIGNLSFEPRIDITVGNGPVCISFGDFDSDGKPDLAVLNNSSKMLTIYKNTSTLDSISFAPRIILETGVSPNELSIGDLDGDKKPDIAVANFVSEYVSVFRNTSSGSIITFASRQDIGISANSYSIAIGDFDGDLKSDLAVTNASPYQVSVFRNISTIGSIAFSPKIDFLSDQYPRSVTICDLDGDGKPDMATANTTLGKIAVYKNTSTIGNICFNSKINFSSTQYPNKITTGDFDGDGKADLVTTGGYYISIFKNTISNIPYVPDSIYGSTIQCASTMGQVYSVDTIVNASSYFWTIPTGWQITDGQGTTVITVTTGSVGQNGNIGVTAGNSCGTSSQQILSVNVTAASPSTPGTISGKVIQCPALTEQTYSINTVADAETYTWTVPTGWQITDGQGTTTITVTTGSAGQNGNLTVIANNSCGSSNPATLFVTVMPFDTIVLTSSTGSDSQTLTVNTPLSNITYSTTGATGATITGLPSGVTGMWASDTIAITGTPDITGVFNYTITLTGGCGSASANGTITVLGNCEPPLITSFSPTSGPVGTQITIYGNDFNTNPSENAVYFGATMADIISCHTDSIIVNVPMGATYSPISVTNINCGLTSSSQRPFTPTFTCGACIDLTSFNPKIDYTTGITPVRSTIGDIDGDGKSDMIVINYADNTFSVLRNLGSSGSISFDTKIDFSTGINPQSISVGDIDGDGKLDVAVLSTDTASIFINNSSIGNISFSPRINYPKQGFNYYIATGDLNGDGKPELIWTETDSISILKNNTISGNISFTGNIKIAVGSPPVCVAIGDLDGDSIPDLATANGSDNTISVLRNTGVSGNISFAPEVVYSANSGPGTVYISDVDKDGKQDLVVGDWDTDTVSVYRNMSSPGNISFTPKIDFKTGSGYIFTEGLTVADIDGDNKPDIAVSNLTDNSFSVLKNLCTPGTISFDTHKDFATELGPSSISAGDLDEDGRPEIIISYYSSTNVISVYKNIISCPCTATLISPTGTDNQTVIKNTGIMQIVYATTNCTGIETAIGLPAGVSATFINDSLIISGTPYDSGTFNYSIVLTSICGGASANGTITVLDNCTPPVITSFSPTSGPIGTQVTIYGNNFNPNPSENVIFFGATMADIINCYSDSIIVGVPYGATYQNISVTDLACGLTGYSAQPFITTFNCGGSIDTNSFAAKVDFTAGTGPQTVSISDLDGDGKADIIVVNFSSNSFSVFKNTSTNGTISFDAKVDYTSGSGPWGISIIDFDGDGKPDIAVSNSSTNTVSIFRNISTVGTISFDAKVDYTAGTDDRKISTGDLDGDGKTDMAIVNYDVHTVSVFRNTSTIGTISFSPKVDYATGDGPDGISIGDIDGDGKPDMAVANWNSSSVSVLRNTSTSGTISFAAKVDYNTGGYAVDISLGDIDGDGKLDMVSTNRAGNSVSVFRNTSISGTISFTARVDFATGTGPYSNSIGDLDGDEKPDIVVAVLTTNTVSVFKNTSTSGNISFNTIVNYAGSSHPIYSSICDLDGDGKPDIAIANTGSNTVSVFRNTITGIPATPGTINGTSIQCPALTNQIYSISAVTDATTYTWTVPTGWQITAGQGTTSITVTTGAIGQNGNLSVTAGNSCGTSEESILAVVVNPTYEYVQNEQICDGTTYNWHGNAYTIAGTYYDSLQTAQGCDSVYVLHLTVYPVYTINNPQTICSGDSYSYYGHTYTIAGAYYDTLNTTLGCDSIIVTQLTVNPVYTVNNPQSICSGDTYSFNGHSYTTAGTYYDTLNTTLGCDSAIVTQLTVNPVYSVNNPQTICSGDSYIFNGHTYTTAGTYYDTLSNTLGCDSIIVTTLTINPLPANIGQTYTLNSLDSGLVAYYPFNGNANDESGNGNHGTVSGATLTTDRFNNSNKAYFFDGSNDLININNSFFNVGWQEYTISGWFLSNNVNKFKQPFINTTPHNGMIINFNHPDCNPKYVMYCLSSDPGLGSWNIVSCAHGSFNNYNNAEWYNFVFEKDSNSFKLYINDSLQHTTLSPILPINYLCQIKIGAYPGNNEYFFGKLDDYRIYNRVLNNQEIQTLFNETNTIAVELIEDTLCQNTDAEILLLNSQAGISYQPIVNNNLYGSPQIGNGDTLNFIIGSSVLGVGNSNITIEATDTATGCSIVLDTTLVIVVSAPYTINNPQTICSVGSYSFNGHNYTTAGTYYDTLATSLGCDSIIVTQLTVNPVYTVNNPQTICSGDSYSFNGHTYTTAGTYYDTLSTNLGCDSIIVTQLTVNPVYTVNNPQTICSGGSYSFNGHSYTTADTYKDTLTTNLGCDSIIVTQLTVNPVYLVNNPQTICNGSSYIFNGHTYTTAGTYYDTLATNLGCDSIIVTQLTVYPVYSVNNPQTICSGNSYIFNGHTYTTAGTYYDTLVTSLGCDSIIVTQLAVNPVYSVNNPQTICSGDTYSFNGHTYTTAGTYNDTLATNLGCDSIIVTQLTVYQVYSVNNPQTICSGNSYIFNGHTYTTAGTYYDTLVTSLGCDSIIVTQLAVNPVYSVNNPQTICSGDTYIFNGHTYSTAGTYYDTLSTSFGCDSIIVTQLTVDPVYTVNNPQTICSGDSYIFNGHNYTTAGTYYDTLSTTLGCDSIIVTQLTVNPVYSVNNPQTICSGDSYIFNGHTYTTAGTYYDTLSTNLGCDSIVATTLTINPLPANIGQTYTLNSLDSSLVAYYPFSGGSTIDFSNNGYNGTPFNGAHPTIDRCGEPNNAYGFDGQNDYIQVNNLPALLEEFSYSVWIRVLDDGSTDKNNNFGCYGLQGNNSSTWDWAYNVNKNWFAIFDNDNNVINKDTSIYAFWNHVVVLYNHSQRFLYYNGSLICQGPISTPLNLNGSTTNLRIGAHMNNAQQPFNGNIDDIRIYDRALTNLEIQALYNTNCNALAVEVVNDTICQNTPAVVLLLNSQSGISYQLSVNNTQHGSPQIGNGDTLNFIIGSSVLGVGNSNITIEATDTATGCSIVLDTTLVIVVSAPYTINNPQTICSGDSYSFNGHTYTIADMYYDTLATNLGCDSIIITQLTVNPVYTANNPQTICSGDTYSFNGHTYITAGTYYDTLSTSLGCDSIIITQLTVNPVYSVNNPQTICSGDTYSFNGHTYITAGTYYDTLATSLGCDSIIVTLLTVYPVYSVNNPQSICNGDSYSFNGHTYTTAGTYKDTLNTNLGCDSIIVTQLTVNPVYLVNNPQTICNGNSYNFNGHTYTTTGTYHDTLATNLGCDSIIVTQLTVNPAYTINNPQTICNGDSYSFNGHTYTTAGTYYDTLTTNLGCDSIIVTQLTVNPVYTINNPQTICSGGSYSFNGHTYTTASTYNDTLATNLGCDSIIVTQLTVNTVYLVNNPQTICSGGSYSFNGHTYTTADTYYDTLSTNLGCDSIIVTQLTVNPVYTVNNPQNICSGDSYSFNGHTYTTAGTYFDTLATNLGCDSIIVTQLTVEPALPVSVSISAYPASTVCAGTTVYFNTLSGNQGNTPHYQWQINGINAGGNAPDFNSSSLANGDIVSCILTSSDVCATGNPANSNAIIMAVNPILPVSVNITAFDDTICAGTNVIFSASTINGGTAPIYQWQINGNNVGGNSPSFSSSTLNNGDLVSCVVTSNLVCTSGNPDTSNVVVMTVYPLPLPVISGSTTYCSGSQALLGTTQNFASYLWSTGDTTATIQVDTSQSPVTVMVTDSNGCTGTSLPVSLTETNFLTPLITGSLIYCQGYNTTLSVGNYDTYLWSTGDVTPSIIVTAASNPISVTVTSSNGCTGVSDSVMLNEVLVTTSSIVAAPDSVCMGQSTTLTTNLGSAYLWSTGDTTQAITVTPLINTTYAVTVYEGGCSSSANILITVTPNLTVIVNPATICMGQTATLTASPGTSYLWSTGQTTQSISVSPSVGTQYTVTVSNNACSDSATAFVVVNTLPVADAGTDKYSCPGQKVILSATGGCNSSSYVWSYNNINAQSIAVFPMATTTYTVTVSACNGCTDADDVVVNVYAACSVYVGQDTTICTGDSITLCASGCTNYIWNNGSVSTCISIAPLVTSMYNVTGEDDNHCLSSDYIWVNVLHPPQSVSVLCQGDTIISSELTGNHWFENGISTGDTNNIFIGNPGNYYYTIVTNICGTDTSGMCLVVKTNNTGMAEAVKIYPNPANSEIFIEIPINMINNKTEIGMYDILGRLLLKKPAEDTFTKIDVSALAKGMYFLRIEGGGNSVVGRFVKE